MVVKGVQFVTDTEGRKVAVLLDLEEWGELWEDIYDNILADERTGESSESLGEFEAELNLGT
jgi:PHD/YefM family antitoxin component YafN of YafNO toxin-antitoxin module